MTTTRDDDPGPAEDELRQLVVAACRRLAAAGLSPGSSGNVSARLGEVMLVTPTGSSLTRVAARDLAVVHLDGTVLAGRPSKEAPLHRAVYACRPGAGAVVHLHSPYAVAAACLATPGAPALPPLTPYQVMRVGDLPVAPYAPPGTAALADGVRALAAEHPALLLGNHGSVAAAADPDGAADLAEEVEAAARVALLVRGLGARELTPDEVAALRRR